MRRISIAGIGLFLILALLTSGCTEQQTTLMDTQIVVNDKDDFTMDLASGKYRVVLQSDETIDISFSTVSSYDKSGVTQYDSVVTLANPAVLKIKNPGLIGIGPSANVLIKVVSNPV